MNILKYSYPVIILGAAAVSAALAIYAWPRRDKTGVAAFAWTMLTVAEWLFTSGLVTLSRTPEGAMVWVKARYTGLMLMVPFFAMYALQYTGFEKWLTLRRTALLFVIPVLSIIITWTNEFHSLMIQSIRFYPDGPLLGLDAVTYGAWFWVHTVYSYLLVVLGVVLLMRMAVRSLRLYRMQSTVLIAGILPPLAASVIDAFLLIPALKHPIAPLGFAIMGVAFAFSMFRYRLINVVPIARDKLVESMSDGMLVLDDQNLIVDINPAAQDFLGIRPADAIGQPAVQALDTWRELIERYRDESTAQAEITLTRGGETRCYDLNITSLVDRREHTQGRLAVWRDITKRKHAEAEREQLIQELDAFAHTVAHDLKTPLALISGFAELLAQTLDQQGELGEEQRIYVQSIIKASARMDGIINALLKLAYIRQVDELNTSRLDMERIVAEALQDLCPMIKAYKAEVISPEVWPDSSGYAPWVEEIWINYLNNAIKYGGQPPRVVLGTDVLDNGMVRFRVQDNGRGLTAEEQVRLFVPFSRLGQVEIEGHGLGLSIVQRITERLGGAVGVESVPGEGSTFWFTLPKV